MSEVELSIAREVVAFAALLLMNATIVVLSRQAMSIANEYLHRKSKQTEMLLSILSKCVTDTTEKTAPTNH